MKASELAIGDWVCVAGPVINGEERHTPPMRVVGMGETWVYLEIDPEQGDPFDENIKDIRPVPLTADILLANGWEWEHPKRLSCDLNKDSKDDPLVHVIRATIFNNGRFFFDVHVPNISLRLYIDYVHELQHALRLAGIEKEIEL